MSLPDRWYAVFVMTGEFAIGIFLQNTHEIFA
jgi:hypothetical protein